jgi:hypothetical protein
MKWRTINSGVVEIDVWCLLYEPMTPGMRVNLLSAYRLSKQGFSYTLPGAINAEPVAMLTVGRDTVRLITMGNHFIMPTAITECMSTYITKDVNQFASTTLDAWEDVRYVMSDNYLDGYKRPGVFVTFQEQIKEQIQEVSPSFFEENSGARSCKSRTSVEAMDSSGGATR